VFSIAILCYKIEALPNKLRVISALGVLALRGGARILGFSKIRELPGDKLTATSAIKHYIPTQTIPANRSITLRNYRIPEHHQKEVDTQIQQMLEDKIIQSSRSPWNFPILIVPKKLDASGKRKWRICVDFRMT